MQLFILATMYHFSKLKNGLRVASAALPHMRSVCVGLWVHVGGRHENLDQNGAAHFIEHMLFKGTSSRSARQISEEIEGLGGYLNAFTSEETTCYYAKAAAEHFPCLLNVLLDMFLNSAFRDEDLRKEREVILEENAMYLDQPQQLVLEKINEILWRKHPLGRSLVGTAQSLKSLNRHRLLAFRDQHYLASNVLIAAAGNLTHGNLMRRARAFSKHLPIGKPAPFERLSQGSERFGYHFISKKIEQLQLAIGFKTCSRHDRRRFALQVLNALLGENMSSRLFQILREDHGLAYNIGSHLNHFEDGGAMILSVGLDPDKLGLALKLIEDQLRLLREEVPPQNEIQRAARYLVGQLDLHLENTENHMMWIGEEVLAFDVILPIETIKQKILAVDGEAIRAVARDFFTRPRTRIALVGPKAKAFRLPSGFLK